ncbi:MAG: potassium efflux system protein [Proteobacteria bacterium]|nr:potassium efflux system protein [Pseudomonadota bacterium]RPJ47864.1 MAG: potassium transporter [Betaproteobacteria bacterium]
MQASLQPVLVLLAAAVLVVVIFRSLKLPPLLGYLIVGVLIGPHALGWVTSTEEVRDLAEIGVVFLMFSIGLEFSLSRLLTMRRIVFGLGGAQVLVTMLLVLGVAGAVGVSWQGGIVLGGALAMSSTAILAKLLAERFELNSPHGQQIIGILLFQDLAVVPLLILIPALGAPAEELAANLGFAILKAVVVLTVLLVVGQRLMRAWFHVVARQKSPELFVLNVLLVTLGVAFLTEMAGLSLALGAFVAGVLISETEYRYQVEEDIKPFRDVLLGLFFVTIGMLLDVRVVVDNAWVSVLLVSLVLAKTALIFGLSRLFGASSGVALRAGLALGACGEFGFVILAHAAASKLMAPDVVQPVLAAMVLSMLIAPFVIERSEAIVRRWSATEWMSRAMQLHNIAVQSMAADAHVVICGYGRSGQNLARFLDREGVPFIALDNDPQRIREATAAGERVVFGDAARREVLLAAGLARARVVIVTYADTTSALHIIAHVQEARPGLPIVVRTIDDSDVEKLRNAGATEVVADLMEASLMLASSTLLLVGVPLTRVLRRIRETREHRYELFRGFYRGMTDATEDDDQALQPRLHSVLVTSGAKAIGRQILDLGLAAIGVEVTAVRRRNVRTATPAPETRIEEGDVVVLLGSEEAVAAAEIKLLQG